MPRIQEYSYRTEVPGASRTTQAQPALTGQGAEAVGEGLIHLGEGIHKAQVQSELSDTSAKLAKVQAQQTVALQDQLKNADPGDKTFVSNFLQNYDQETQKIGENLSTSEARLHFNEANARLRSHFLLTAATGQSHLEGEKAVLDKKEMLTAMSSAALNDPLGADVSRENAKQSIYSDTRLSQPDKDKLWQGFNSELTQNEIRGYIGTDPNYAKEELRSGRWQSTISGDAEHALLGEADRRIKENRAEEEHNLRFNEYKKHLQDEVTALDLSQKLEDRTLTPTQVRNAGLNDHSLYEHYMNAINKPKNTYDPTVYAELSRRINLPDGDPDQLRTIGEVTSYLGEGIDPGHNTLLLGQFKRRMTVDGRTEAEAINNFKKQVRPLIVKGPIGTDPVAEVNWGRASAEFDQEFNKRREAGDTVKELLDTTGGPKSLYPMMLKHSMTMDDIGSSLNYRLGNERSALPPTPSALSQPKTPKLPNESTTDYLKRIKGGK